MNNREIFLGISCFYHDSSAVLVKDGEILIALQEERFSRKKFDNNFPLMSIKACLDYGNLSIKDVDCISFYEDPNLKLNRIINSDTIFKKGSFFNNLKKAINWNSNKNIFTEIIKYYFPEFEGKILFFKHHFSHAASAFYPSPFEQSAILTVDGVGEWSTSTIGVGNNNEITLNYEERFPNSIGLFYSSLTQFCGFKVLSGEYKLMGLAPYGDPIYVNEINDNIIESNDDGSINMNQDYFNYTTGNTMISNKFSELFKIKPRDENESIITKYMDIAASAQKVLENIMIKKVNYTLKVTEQEYLCMAGGVALNCVSNEKISKITKLKDIWIQPASGDSGAALGSALAAYYFYNNKSSVRKDNTNLQKSSLLGLKFTNIEIKKILEELNFEYEYFDTDERNHVIAEKLIAQNIIAIFQGRMEFGPRALGSRSIIADPRNQNMQKKLNLKIKFRESFRPFAPAILEEHLDAWFDSKIKKSPYMLFTAQVNKDKINNINLNDYEGFDKLNANRSEVPAITHVDYSARIQTVNNLNENFYKIIQCFYEQTKVPILINTSFNVRGEPIVNTPIDALQCFINTNIDILVLENYIIYKSNQKNVLLTSNLENIKPD